MWFSLKLAGDFRKKCEGETSSSLSVTDASLAVAGLTALNPIASIGTVCKEKKKHLFLGDTSIFEGLNSKSQTMGRYNHQVQYSLES